MRDRLALAGNPSFVPRRTGVHLVVAGVAAAAVVMLVCLVAVYVVPFRGSFVFLTVEESSTSALLSWPLFWDRAPQAYFDPADKVLEIPSKVSLAGVSLVVYYSAVSQGVEFADDLRFSRTGRNSVALLAPLSVETRDWEAREVEIVDNSARVLRANLKVKKTTSSGTVHLVYGEREIILAPGESWAELVLRTPLGIVEVDPQDWSTRLNEAYENEWPATRLAIANFGLWPKGSVRVGVVP